MIDWDEDLECDLGKVTFVSREYGDYKVDMPGISYWVKENGTPNLKELRESFTVRNKQSNRDRAITMFDAMPATSNLGAGTVFIDELIKAGLFNEERLE